MKIICVISILILIFGSGLSAQTNSNCNPKTIRTDPNNAINTELPSKANTNGQILDWLIDCPDTWPINCQFLYPNPNTVISPFDQGNNPITQYFRQVKDRSPEDGWELVTRNFGYYDDGTPNNGEDNPYFILYNRFTGKLRVFFLIANYMQDYNYAEITISYPNYIPNQIRPSTLDLGLASDIKPLRALDDFTSGAKIISTVEFFNNTLKWAFTDFNLMYDPCVCNYLSHIEIRIKLIDEAFIELTGETEGVIADISDKESNNPDSEIDDNTSVISLSLQGGNQVIKSYKGWDSFRQNINSHISASNSSSEQKASMTQSLNILESTVKSNSALGDIMSYIPIVGGALGLIDFLNGIGKKSYTDVRLQPCSIVTTTKTNGTIISSANYQVINFWNPGSDHLVADPTYLQYPYYNQILGVFNLLRTPEINLNKRRKMSWISTATPGYCSDWNPVERSTLWTVNDTLYFKFPNDIEYLINPASGLKTNAEDIDISASLYFEFDDQDYNYSFPVEVEYERIMPNPELIDTDLIINEKEGVWRTQYIPLECMTGKTVKLITAHSYKYYCNWNEDDGLTDVLPMYEFESPKVYIKLIVNLKVDNPAEDGVSTSFFVLKYPVNINEVEQQEDSYWESSWYNIPKDITLENTTITSDLKAWGNITINENVTTSGGPYTLTAGQSIIVNDNNSYNPDLILEVGNPSDCSASKYGPVTNLGDFCTSTASNGYQPNNRDYIRNVPRVEVEINESKPGNDMIKIFPNPANDHVIIKAGLSRESLVSIEIKDAFGNTAIDIVNNKAVSGGIETYNVDISKLLPGIYHIVLTTDRGRLTQKLIVAR